MKHAETVTFGGSGLDRAAALRSDTGGLAAALQHPAARMVLVWRGKPLVCGGDDLALARVASDHRVLTETRAAPVFLGHDAGGPVFAHDISSWEPDATQETARPGFFDPTEQRHPDLPETTRFLELRGIMTRLSARDAELAATAKALLGWHATHGFCARCGAESRMHQAGWQRICPDCGAHHFPRTDPVVIMLVIHGNACLLGRSHGWPDGMYSCLAGFVEPGETMEAAVRREVLEETGIAIGPVRYLASQPWPFPASLMLGCHGRALGREITIDETEIEDARWVSREDLALAMAGGHPWLKPARQGAIARFMLDAWLSDRLAP